MYDTWRSLRRRTRRPCQHTVQTGISVAPCGVGHASGHSGVATVNEVDDGTAPRGSHRLSVFFETCQPAFAGALHAVEGIARATRQDLEAGRVDHELLRRLYGDYEPLNNLDAFIKAAEQLFPVGNCGIASLLLRERLGRGRVHTGSYDGHCTRSSCSQRRSRLTSPPISSAGPKCTLGLFVCHGPTSRRKIRRTWQQAMGRQGRQCLRKAEGNP